MQSVSEFASATTTPLTAAEGGGATALTPAAAGGIGLAAETTNAADMASRLRLQELQKLPGWQ